VEKSLDLNHTDFNQPTLSQFTQQNIVQA